MYRQRLDQLLNEQKAAEAVFRTEQKALIAAEDYEVQCEEAQTIIQSVSQKIQQDAHGRISSVVSKCLEAVFDDPYEFQILFERKRGKTEATLAFVRDGIVLTNPQKEIGGGVIDVAAFALRLICLALTKPIRRRVLILDEPFTRIRGIENRKRMRQLLISLAEDFGFQFITCIDHESFPQFLLGHVIEIGEC